MRNKIANIGLLLLSLFFSLSITEVVLKRMTTVFPLDVGETANLEIQFDRRVLYRIRPNLAAGINSLGYRDHEFTIAKKPDEIRMFVVGDSFVMGLNVSRQDLFSNLLESKLGIPYEVFNMGTIGYGPDQELLRLIDDGLAYAPDVVILCIHPSNDFADLAKNQLYTLNDQLELKQNQLNPVSKIIPKFGIAAIPRLIKTGRLFDAGAFESLNMRLLADGYDPMFSQPEKIVMYKAALMRLILKEFKQQLDNIGARLIVVVIPSFDSIQDDKALKEKGIDKKNYFWNEALLKAILNTLEIESLDLTQQFLRQRYRTLFDPVDHHLSNAGHAFVTSLLVDNFFQKTASAQHKIIHNKNRSHD